MTTASTVVTIPLYPGVSGDLLAYPDTKLGTQVTGKIHWIVPVEIQFPDGWAIFKVRFRPKLHKYEGNIEFEIWDKYQLSTPKYMGKVKINCADNSYEVEMDQRYHCYRLSALFTLTHSPQEPFRSNAYRNQTPYGDWRYKDII